MSSNFVYNGTPLPGNKVDATTNPGPSQNYADASDFNTIFGAIADIRTQILSAVNICAHGADPTGVTSSSSALVAAYTALQPNGGIVHLPVGTYRISSNVVVPGNITLSHDTSMFTIDNGYSLTIKGTIDAPAVQIFSYTPQPYGGGINPVIFGTMPQTLNVKWFGAVGDGSTDDTDAFVQACLSLSTFTGAIHDLPSPYLGGFNATSQGLPELIVPAGHYEINSTVELPGLSSIRGEGLAQLQTSASIPILRVGALGKVTQIVFAGGLHAIALYGGAVANGGGFNPTDFGNTPLQIDRCSFLYQTGPSIWQDLSPATTVAAGSDGVTLPIAGGVLNLVNTFGFTVTNAGNLMVFLADNNVQYLSYTGKVGNTFTGVTGGTGTLHTGMLVQDSRYARTAQSVTEITNFYMAGPCLFWGAGDAISFTNGHISWDMTSYPTDTNGLPLGIFNGGCRISNVTGFGIGTQPARAAFLVGTFWQLNDVRIGQNTEMCLCRSQLIENWYQGAAAVPVPLPAQGVATPLSLALDRCDLTACDGAFWLEIYDNIPAMVSIHQRLQSPPFDFDNTNGIWVDQAVPLTQLRTLLAQTHVFDFDYPNSGNEFRFYRGWDPGALVAPSKLTGVDITNQVINCLANPDSNSAELQPNLFGTASATANGNFGIASGTTGSPDTTSGFSLTTYVPGLGIASYGSGDFSSPNAFPTTLPAGVYCVSFYFKSNFPAFWGVSASEANDEGLELKAFDNADYVQRVEFPFFYPGNATAFFLTLLLDPVPGIILAWSSGMTAAKGQQVTNGGNLYLAVVGGVAGVVGPSGTGAGFIDGGITWNYVDIAEFTTFTPAISVGLFMLNKGRKAAPYVFPLNADTNIQPGWVHQTYYGTAAPTLNTDTYQTGNVMWNTAPSPGGNIGWVCTSGGSPGTWKAFGQITL